MSDSESVFDSKEHARKVVDKTEHGEEWLLKLPRDLRGHDLPLDRIYAWGEPSKEKSLRVFGASQHGRCLACGEQVEIFTDGEHLFAGKGGGRFSNDFAGDADPCRFGGKLPITEFFLNVPSGRLVVANDLRYFFPCDEPSESINLPFGCHEMALAYAEGGLAHGCVGNTSPGVWQDREDGGRLWIASRWSRDEEGGDEERPPEGVPTTAHDLGEEAGAATRLVPGAAGTPRIAVVAEAIEPRRHRDDLDIPAAPLVPFRAVPLQAPIVLVTVGDRVPPQIGTDAGDDMRVADALPPVDYEAIENAKRVTPEQHIAQSLRNYPQLYGETFDHIMSFEKRKLSHVETAVRVADHVLFSIGNGVEWHPNGHPRIRLDPDIAACPRPIEIPVFDFRAHWYPLSENHSAIAHAAGFGDGGIHADRGRKLSPDFARLAFNCLQCLIWYGTEPFGTDKNHIKQARETMKLGVRIYWALAEKYPDEAMAYPEFGGWMMSNEDVLDRYCDTVELKNKAGGE